MDFAPSLDERDFNLKAVKRRWSLAKVPAFLYPYFPLIRQGSLIKHEFLTGKPIIQLKKERHVGKFPLIRGIL